MDSIADAKSTVHCTALYVCLQQCTLYSMIAIYIKTFILYACHKEQLSDLFEYGQVYKISVTCLSVRMYEFCHMFAAS